MLRVFEQYLSNQPGDCCCGVTVAQCHCLFAIEDLSQTTVGTLADYLHLDKSTLSRTVESLVRLGYLKRENNINDRRSYQIKLTQPGSQQVEKMHRVNDAYFTKVFEQMPEAESESVRHYLGLFVDAIRQYEDSIYIKNDPCCEE